MPCEPCTYDGIGSRTTGNASLGMSPIYNGTYGNSSNQLHSGSYGGYPGTLHTYIPPQSYSSRVYPGENRWNNGAGQYERSYGYGHGGGYRDQYYYRDCEHWPGGQDRRYGSGSSYPYRRRYGGYNDRDYEPYHHQGMFESGGRAVYGYNHGYADDFGAPYRHRHFEFNSPVMTSPAFALSRSRAAVRPGAFY